MGKREQADEIVTDAFEAHLAEGPQDGKPFDRRVRAIAKLRGEIAVLAEEKGVNRRTLAAAFERLRFRAVNIHDAAHSR